ncbi:peptide MFS transporter [Nitrospirillum sp. BR 11828]|uniref:peptide MFS transporter n=1 Tax=Nitrospirillum sp. BR 11828 TaxID=3104325 RepID=UPI002ACA5AB1|nr:peptide MFS transporter [Nitrospirillum sp. BR 11828]MDZ5647119.1 peptide MFS transporter [Nitrospirillum sp. BR 11828]
MGIATAGAGGPERAGTRDAQDQAGGHPPGLYLLFAVEFWERFSYYGLQSILIFFLLWHLSMDKVSAYAELGAFGVLVYMCPVLGGFIADRWVGARHAVRAGAVLLMMGHGLMAWQPAQTVERLVTPDATYDLKRPILYPAEGEEGARQVVVNGTAQVITSLSSVQGEDADARALTYVGPDGAPVTLRGRLEKTPDAGGLRLFYLSLALIAAGVGMLKPNISALVGRLYGDRHAARDRGFLIFYLGINAGGLMGSIVCGWLGAVLGWEWGFGAAGIGMAVALATFSLGRRLLPDELPVAQGGPRAAAGLPGGFAALAGGVALALACWLIVDRPAVVGHVLDIAAVAGLAAVFWFARTCDARQRRHLALLLLLMLVSVLYWTLFYQGPASLNVFAAEWTDRHIGPVLVPAPVLQFPDKAFVILLALPLAALWRWLDGRRRAPGPVTKFGFGVLFVGLGFLALAFGIEVTPAGLRVGVAWLLSLYLLQEVGELCLSPTGLSAITRLSPPAITSLLVGLWFLSTAYGQRLSALVAQATVVDGSLPAAVQLASYQAVYLKAGLWSCAAALLLLLLVVPLRRLND